MVCFIILFFRLLARGDFPDILFVKMFVVKKQIRRFGAKVKILWEIGFLSQNTEGSLFSNFLNLLIYLLTQNRRKMLY
jgi:hypothetical protein